MIMEKVQIDMGLKSKKLGWSEGGQLMIPVELTFEIKIPEGFMKSPDDARGIANIFMDRFGEETQPVIDQIGKEMMECLKGAMGL